MDSDELTADEIRFIRTTIDTDEAAFVDRVAKIDAKLARMEKAARLLESRNANPF